MKLKILSKAKKTSDVLHSKAFNTLRFYPASAKQGTSMIKSSLRLSDFAWNKI